MRYIDADELIKKIYTMGMGDGMYVINAKAVKFAIDNTPTADVVPKSECDKWKQLFYDAKKVIGENAQRGLQVTLEEIEKAKAEVAREIFEDIGKQSIYHFAMRSYSISELKLAELKNKYAEGKT